MSPQNRRTIATPLILQPGLVLNISPHVDVRRAHPQVFRNGARFCLPMFRAFCSLSCDQGIDLRFAIVGVTRPDPLTENTNETTKSVS